VDSKWFGVFAAFSFFAAGFFSGNLYAASGLNDFELPTRDVKVERPDVSVINNHSVSNRFSPERFFYIQPAKHDVELDWNGRTAEVRTDQVLYNQGSSMRPTFWTGHTLLAQQTDGEDLDEGTIVSNGNFTHRIKADYTDTGGYYLTQGDNNNDYERMAPSEVKYKVVGVIYTDR
jgi:hypothetical protein